MDKQPRHFTAEEKVKALRRHLAEKVPVSALREELGIEAAVFYR